MEDGTTDIACAANQPCLLLIIVIVVVVSIALAKSWKSMAVHPRLASSTKVLLSCLIASVLPRLVTAVPYSGVAPAAAKNAAFERGGGDNTSMEVCVFCV
jgi:hypothetical protein